MNMNSCSNKTPIEVIKEDDFGGTCFTDIYWLVRSLDDERQINRRKEIVSRF